MRITVHYGAQVKAAAGVSSRVVDVPDNTHLQDLVRQIACDGGDALRGLLIDKQGKVHPTLLLFVEDELVPRHQPHPLRDGQTLAIMSPISGG